MRCPITTQAELAPEQPALIYKEQSWSYRELDELVQGASEKLRVIPGERIAFVAKNEWQTVILLFALFRLGAIACPLSPRLPREALEQTIADLNASFVDPKALSFKRRASSDGFVDFQQEATLLFTSGSTGRPKIAGHTLGNHLYNAIGSNLVSNLGPSHRWLLSLPLFHVGGLAILFRCFLAGGTVIISQDLLDPRATHLSLVPTQLYRLLVEAASLSHLEMILLGGAPIPSSLQCEALERGLNLVTTYGMTEMSSQITHDGSILPHREVHIAEDKEIWVRGQTLFKGYWSLEKGYDLPVDKEGWFPTRDLGSWSADEKLIIVGRKDNLFISGGENIQPEEVEEVLLSLPGIEQAVIVPLPDEEFGARPAAFIYAKEPTYTLEYLRASLEKRLPRFKHPVHLFYLEKPIEGKAPRQELMQRARELAEAF